MAVAVDRDRRVCRSVGTIELEGDTRAAHAHEHMIAAPVADGERRDWRGTRYTRAAREGQEQRANRELSHVFQTIERAR